MFDVITFFLQVINTPTGSILGVIWSAFLTIFPTIFKSVDASHASTDGHGDIDPDNRSVLSFFLAMRFSAIA